MAISALIRIDCSKWLRANLMVQPLIHAMDMGTVTNSLTLQTNEERINVKWQW